MQLVASKTEIHLDPSRPQSIIVASDNGAPLSPEHMGASCDEEALSDGTDFCCEDDSIDGAVTTTFDLRRCRNLPDPGPYTVVLTAQTNGDGSGAASTPSLLPIRVTLDEKRSCIALAAVVPSVSLTSTTSALLTLRLYNRCGHSVGFDLEVTWDEASRGIKTGLSVGAHSFVDVDMRLDAADAIDDLTNGRVPDDFKLTVSKSAGPGSIELVVEADDVEVDGSLTVIEGGGDEHADRASKPPPPPRPAPLPGPRPLRRAGIWVLAAVTTVVLIVAIASAGNDSEPNDFGTSDEETASAAEAEEGSDEVDGPTTFEIGDYRGMTEADALATVDADGFGATVTEIRVDDQADEGIVVSQSPRPGVTGNGNTTVALYVGQTSDVPPPDLIEIGNYEGMVVDDAIDGLEALDLTADVTLVEVNDPGEDGRVLRESPLAGTEVEPGSTVRLMIGRHQENLSDLDDFEGTAFGLAEDKLAEAGFEAETRFKDTFDPNEDGIVLAQDPAPGQYPAGTIVRLTVGRLAGVEIPDLTGTNFAEAGQVMFDLQRAVGESSPSYRPSIQCGATPPDTVVGQQPAPGTIVTGPFDATLVKAVTCLPVPDLRGSVLADAADELAQWAQQGRTYLSFENSCPDPTSNEANNLRINIQLPDPSLTNDAVGHFTMRCEPIIR